MLTKRLEPGRIYDFKVSVKDTRGGMAQQLCSITATNFTTPHDMIFPHKTGIIMVPEVGGSINVSLFGYLFSGLVRIIKRKLWMNYWNVGIRSNYSQGFQMIWSCFPNHFFLVIIFSAHIFGKQKLYLLHFNCNLCWYFAVKKIVYHSDHSIHRLFMQKLT